MMRGIIVPEHHFLILVLVMIGVLYLAQCVVYQLSHMKLGAISEYDRSFEVSFPLGGRSSVHCHLSNFRVRFQKFN